MKKKLAFTNNTPTIKTIAEVGEGEEAIVEFNRDDESIWPSQAPFIVLQVGE